MVQQHEPFLKKRKKRWKLKNLHRGMMLE